MTLQAFGAGYFIPPASTWVPGTTANLSIRFNDDACTDRIVGSTVLISQCNGIAANSLAAPGMPLQLLDWDGDGKTDILIDNGGNFGVYLSTGNGLAGPISTPIPSYGAYFAADQDGDHLEDLIKLNGTSAISYWTHTSTGSVSTTFATNVPDLLSSVLDGFGVAHSINYVSTASGSYDKGTTTNFPLQETEPLIVVSTVTSSNGAGGIYSRTFNYVGARENADRGTFAGYQRIEETDSRNGLISRLYFEQAFPIAGMVSKQEVIQPNGTTPISRTVFTNGFAPLETAANNQRYFTYPSASTSTQYEAGGTFNGALLRTVAASFLYDTASGSLYDQTTTITEPASGANGVTAGGTWTSRTYLPLANTINDAANWCLGRPGQTQQTNSHNLSYGAAITRTTNIAWDASLCRPTQTINESGGPWQVTTDIHYDSFGNLDSTTVTGSGMTSRTTSISYSNATFTTGQFPLTVTNAEGHITVRAWNYDLGVPSSETDPNGLTTSWQYDSYGRRIRETRTDDTYTTWDILPCSGCDARGKTYLDQNERTPGGGVVVRRMSVLDQFDRSLYEYDLRPDNQYTVNQREFNALGQVSTTYLPYINSAGMVGSETVTYDLVGRPSVVSRPISQANSAPQSTYFYYEGLTSRVVDAQGKQVSRVTNSAGQTFRTVDHNNHFKAFEYDPFGDVKRVTDSDGNVLQESNYNIRGMLTQRTDLDLGAWSFTPNALGETISQTDAKSHATSFQFDRLGRLISRSETEGTSTWIWGISGSAKNIGQLASVSGPGYSESYVYDSKGRPSITTVSADTTYQVDYSYNNFGALDTLTYPTSTSGYRLKLQYEYQNGTLNKIKDYNAPTYVFWSANSFSARFQPVVEGLGNGVFTVRSYDTVTGWLKTIQSGLGGGTGLQNLAYEWDLAGNLKKRTDANQSNLMEEFFYDNLYRLDSSKLNTVPNLSLLYDSLGNITSKSDVGTYAYHTIKKHRLLSTSNGWSFTYDANGNMETGAGRTTTWTSYNFPASIASGSSNSSFSYTPGRQYWRQVSNYPDGAATTIYVGNLLEKVTTNGGTDFRHYVRAGNATIIVSRQSGGTNSVNYVTTDHFGSSSVVTNGGGAPLVNLSFAAYGKRRGSNWAGSPSAGDWAAIAATTRRGYTDHTMLDNLALIHMNGRVQDPTLGRFLSADPFIAAPLNTQNYNRYSYVSNRPLTFTDPSGFCEEGEEEIPVLDLEIPSAVPQCRTVVTVTGTRPNDPSSSLVEFIQRILDSDIALGVDFLTPVRAGGVTPRDPPTGRPPQGGTQDPRCKQVLPDGRTPNENKREIQIRLAIEKNAGGTGLDTFIYWFSNVVNGGRWDYKVHGGTQPDGNFNFGAVSSPLFSEYVTKNGAGAVQLTLGDRSVSEGIWLISAPFGDQKSDAYDVEAGYRGGCG